MEIPCKCGHIHVDKSTIILKRDPIFGQLKPECRICHRRVIIRTVSPREFKDLMRSSS